MKTGSNMQGLIAALLTQSRLLRPPRCLSFFVAWLQPQARDQKSETAAAAAGAAPARLKKHDLPISHYATASGDTIRGDRASPNNVNIRHDDAPPTIIRSSRSGVSGDRLALAPRHSPSTATNLDYDPGSRRDTGDDSDASPERSAWVSKRRRSIKQGRGGGAVVRLEPPILEFRASPLCIPASAVVEVRNEGRWEENGHK